MGLAGLLFECAIMAAGTFAVGHIPLLLSGERSSGTRRVTSWLRTQSISSFSVGLLISTALSVVLPEGVAVVIRSLQAGNEGEHEGEVHEHLEDPIAEANVSGYIGSALCAGFLLMFCVHQLAGSSASPRKAEPVNGSSEGVNNQPYSNGDRHNAYGIHDADQDAESQALSGSASTSDFFSVASSAKHLTKLDSHRRGSDACNPFDATSPAFSTLLGLMFHALADGISLGAASVFSSTSEREAKSGLSFLVFLSLMIHKAPVAFSLSSLLLSSVSRANLRSQKQYIRKALGAFSLATPAGAVITWILLKLLTFVSLSSSVDDNLEEDGNLDGPLAQSMRGRMEFWTGMALLFSAGTFLFVATHVLNDVEVSNPHGDRECLMMEEESVGLHSVDAKRPHASVFILGMIVPLALSFALAGHHGH